MKKEPILCDRCARPILGSCNNYILTGAFGQVFHGKPAPRKAFTIICRFHPYCQSLRELRRIDIATPKVLSDHASFHL